MEILMDAPNISNESWFFVVVLLLLLLLLFLFSLTSLSRLFHSYRDQPIRRWGETGVPRESVTILPVKSVCSYSFDR